MCSGWYKEDLISFARTPAGKVVLVALVIIALLLGFIAQNHTNPFMPPALLMHSLAGGLQRFYHTGGKNGLGPVRVLNDICLMVTVYLVLTGAGCPCIASQAGFLFRWVNIRFIPLFCMSTSYFW